jgi:hypothetical protein
LQLLQPTCTYGENEEKVAQLFHNFFMSFSFFRESHFRFLSFFISGFSQKTTMASQPQPRHENCGKGG